MEASLARLPRRLRSHGIDLLALCWIGRTFLDMRGICELIIVKVIQVIIVFGRYILHEPLIVIITSSWLRRHLSVICISSHSIITLSLIGGQRSPIEEPHAILISLVHFVRRLSWWFFIPVVICIVSYHVSKIACFDTWLICSCCSCSDKLRRRVPAKQRVGARCIYTAHARSIAHVTISLVEEIGGSFGCPNRCRHFWAIRVGSLRYSSAHHIIIWRCCPICIHCLALGALSSRGLIHLKWGLCLLGRVVNVWQGAIYSLWPSSRGQGYSSWLSLHDRKEVRNHVQHGVESLVFVVLTN